MIDPLAHAHINVVGGVVIFVMGASYYLLPRLTGTRIHSKTLIEHTFWWTTLGIIGFYSTLMTFGILEGRALLANPDDSAAIEAIHHYYGPIISVVSSVMGVGFWLYFFNLYKTARRAFRNK
jgi:cytochrome c oxidase cbb3-type subunit 1